MDDDRRICLPDGSYVRPETRQERIDTEIFNGSVHAVRMASLAFLVVLAILFGTGTLPAAEWLAELVHGTERMDELRTDQEAGR